MNVIIRTGLIFAASTVTAVALFSAVHILDRRPELPAPVATAAAPVGVQGIVMVGEITSVPPETAPVYVTGNTTPKAVKTSEGDYIRKCETYGMYARGHEGHIDASNRVVICKLYPRRG